VVGIGNWELLGLHLFGLTLQIRVHDCNMVVAADDVAEC